MKIKRIDLDGTGSPIGLVTRILKTENDLPIPVPIEELAQQLDIQEIAKLEMEGFEGGLVTDAERSTGIILVNRQASEGRRRFTIAHELGHFLIISHAPVNGDKFLCSRTDMVTWPAEDNNRHARMEAEANEFSALLLMPPPLLRKVVSKERDPNLAQIPILARHFRVSKEAAAWAYSRYHDQNIAIVVTKNRVIKRIHKSSQFPWITASCGSPVPKASVLHRKNLEERVASDVVSTLPDNWIEVTFGQRPPELYEQVYPQRDGYALLMLWLDRESIDDEFDPDENRTSKQRLRDRQFRWSQGRGT
jgi:Zn-dependent peptidase ImmA (M78 family)